MEKAKNRTVAQPLSLTFVGNCWGGKAVLFSWLEKSSYMGSPILCGGGKKKKKESKNKIKVMQNYFHVQIKFGSTFG